MDTVARRKSASRARDSGSYSGLQFTVLVASLALVLGCASADDRLRCCMRGIKRMKTIELCPAPCCIGYHEEVSNPPNLGPMVWCEKNESLCCMRGVKRLRSVQLCHPPCCSGYSERVYHLRSLDPMVVCERDKTSQSLIYPSRKVKKDIEVEETPRNTMFNPLLFRLNQARSGRR